MAGLRRGDMGGPLVAIKTVGGRQVERCLYGVINSPQVKGDLTLSGPIAWGKAHKDKQKPVKYTGWGKHVRISTMQGLIKNDLLWEGWRDPDWVEDQPTFTGSHFH